MTLDALLPLPPPGFETSSEYRLTPRPKRAFHTILDAHKLLVPGSKGNLTFRDVDEGHIELATKYEVAAGTIEESFILRKTPGGSRASGSSGACTTARGHRFGGKR